MLDVLVDWDETYRQAAVEALQTIVSDDDLPLLINVVQNNRIVVLRSGIQVLCSIKSPAISPALVEMLTVPDKESRELITRTLIQLKDSSVIPGLINYLSAADEEVRVSAVRILGALGDKSICSPLIEAFNDKSWRVRKHAIDAIGAIGARSSLNDLIKLLNDKSLSVRQAANRTLFQVGMLALPLLNQALKNKDEKSQKPIRELIQRDMNRSP